MSVVTLDVREELKKRFLVSCTGCNNDLNPDQSKVFHRKKAHPRTIFVELVCSTCNKKRLLLWLLPCKLNPLNLRGARVVSLKGLEQTQRSAVQELESLTIKPRLI